MRPRGGRGGRPGEERRRHVLTDPVPAVDLRRDGPSGARPRTTAPVTAGTHLVGLVVLYGWYLVLYPVGGVALMSVVFALHARLAVSAPALTATGAVFRLLWGGPLIASSMVHLFGRVLLVGAWMSLLRDAARDGVAADRPVAHTA